MKNCNSHRVRYQNITEAAQWRQMLKLARTTTKAVWHVCWNKLLNKERYHMVGTYDFQPSRNAHATQLQLLAARGLTLYDVTIVVCNLNFCFYNTKRSWALSLLSIQLTKDHNSLQQQTKHKNNRLSSQRQTTESMMCSFCALIGITA